MRIDLETIKKIEHYLTDNMSVIENKLFEQDMSGSRELRQAVLEQKNLIMAMEKSTIKNLAVNAGIKYRRNLIIKYVAGAFTIVLLVLGGYFVYDNLNDSKSGVEDALVENVVPKNESNPDENTQVTTTTKDSISSGQTNFKPTTTYKGSSIHSTFSHLVDSDKNITLSTINNDDTLKVKYKIGVNINDQVDSVKKVLQPKVDNSKIFHYFAKESEFFTVPVNKDIRIKGIDGTKIVIPGGSLVDEDGMSVTGNVTVQLIESYKKSDFIFGNLPTESNGQLLESGGMIYVDVMQNDKKLKLKSNKKIQIEFGGKIKNDSMLLFNAANTNDKSDWILNENYQTKYDTTFTTWKGSDAVVGKKSKRKHWFNNRKTMNDTVVASRVKKSNPAFDNLVLESGQLGWISCNKFLENKNNTTLTVRHNLGYAPVVRLVFPSINSMMASQQDGNDETVFQDIPVGMEVDIVVFAMFDDEPYYFTKRITIAKNHLVTIDLEKTTMDDLQKSIRKFDNPGKSKDFQLMN